MWLNLLRAPAAPFVPQAWHGELVCVMAVCYSGELDRVDEVMAPIRALGEPVIDLLAERPYTELQSLLDDDRAQGRTTTTGRPGSPASSATTCSPTRASWRPSARSRTRRSASCTWAAR